MSRRYRMIPYIQCLYKDLETACNLFGYFIIIFMKLVEKVQFCHHKLVRLGQYIVFVVSIVVCSKSYIQKQYRKFGERIEIAPNYEFETFDILFFVHLFHCTDYVIELYYNIII